MLRRLLLPGLILSACSNGPDADLPSIAEARSLGAEWAMINEQAARGQLTRPYVTTMREQLRQQLQSDLTSLTQLDSRYADEIRALLAQPDEAPPEELRAHAAQLKQIEDRLESD